MVKTIFLGKSFTYYKQGGEKIKKLSKKILFITLILSIFLINISTVNAVDVTLNYTDAGGINDAINDVASGSDTENKITLNPGTYNKTTDRNNNISFTGKNLTIEGNGPTGSVVIDAQKMGRIFNISGNSNITFINITFINGNIAGTGLPASGGAILKSGTGILNIINCRFSNNTAYAGGAIYSSSRMDITSSEFINNEAQSGGAIASTGRSTISNSSFTNNKATNGGGAIYNNNFGNSQINNSTFLNNTANGGRGGAIYNANPSTVNVSGSNFINNTANLGSAISNDNRGNIDVSYSRFVNNTDPDNYTIYNTGDKVVLDYNWWSSNLDPNLQVFNGIVNNYFIMSVTNITSLNSNGTVLFQYTFKLNTDDPFDARLLPYFVTNVYTNITTGTIYTFDARFDRIVNVTLNNSSQPVEYIFITDNEIQRLGGFINVSKIETNIEVNSPTDKNGETITLTAKLTDKNGTPLVGKELTFHIAGKTITAITDSNGIARIQYTINKNDFDNNKLIFTVTFEGDNIYLSSDGTGIITLIEPPNPPTPNNTTNQTNQTTNNPTAASAAMKETGIPINLILIIILSTLGILIRRKQ